MIDLTDNRMGALKACRRALAERGEYTDQQLAAAFAKFDVRALEADGEVIGMIATRGPEVHVAVVPEYHGRWLSRRIERRVIDPLLKNFGYAIAPVMADNFIGRQFVERLRFKNMEESDGIVMYRRSA